MELRERVGAALSSLQTNIPGLTSNEYNNVTTRLSAPSPFKGSHYRSHSIKSDIVKNGRAEANMQRSHWRGKCVSTSTGSSGKSSRICTVSVSSSVSLDAVKWLTSECAIMKRSQSSPATASSPQDAAAERCGSYFCFGLRSVRIIYDSHTIMLLVKQTLTCTNALWRSCAPMLHLYLSTVGHALFLNKHE